MSQEGKKQNKGKPERIYDRYKSDMYKVAYRILEDEHMAQDAVQTSFIKIMQNQDKIDETNCNKTRGFIVTIVSNESIDMLRKRKRESNTTLEDKEDYIPDGGPSFDERMIKDELSDRISVKVKELDQSDSDIISLKYYYHFSDKEIAEMLNISHENVRVRLHRARQRLKKLLMEDEEWWKDE